eukprot:jgi/Picsp_1/3701/NSC_06537-R1_---NA---
MREGVTLSKEEHMARDQEERKNQEDRKKSRRHTLFFQPVVKGSQNVDCNAIEEVGTVEENNTEQGSSFRQGMEVFLRLAFIDNEQVDCKLVAVARRDVREKGIIGKVIIEEMVGKLSLN